MIINLSKYIAGFLVVVTVCCLVLGLAALFLRARGRQRSGVLDKLLVAMIVLLMVFSALCLFGMTLKEVSVFNIGGANASSAAPFLNSNLLLLIPKLAFIVLLYLFFSCLRAGATPGTKEMPRALFTLYLLLAAVVPVAISCLLFVQSPAALPTILAWGLLCAVLGVIGYRKYLRTSARKR